MSIMWIVAIAWIYVVLLMAATEPSIVAAIMTFVFYCLVPLSILFYLAGGRARRARRDAAGAPSDGGGDGAGDSASHGADGGGSD